MNADVAGNAAINDGVLFFGVLLWIQAAENSESDPGVNDFAHDAKTISKLSGKNERGRFESG